MQLGKYQHYKGNIYEVIGIALHSETLEELVIYKSIDNDKKIWARPKSMFLENVEVSEKIIPRFKIIK